MGRHRGEGTVEAFRHILREGGPAAFWRGTGPKMVESGIWPGNREFGACGNAVKRKEFLPGFQK